MEWKMGVKWIKKKKNLVFVFVGWVVVRRVVVLKWWWFSVGLVGGVDLFGGWLGEVG